MRRSIQGVVLFASVAAGGAAHGQEAVQWRVEDGGNGHWYAFVECTTGFNAEAAAIGLRGHLATIGSSGENAFVRGILAKSTRQFAMIGLVQDHNQPSVSSGWRWTTGEEVSFTNWTDFGGAYEFVAPDDRPCAGPTAEEDNQCNQGLMYLDGRWDDIERGDSCAGFATSSIAIVEFDEDCNADGIVDFGQCRNGTLADLNSNGTPDCCEAGVDCDQASESVDRCAVFARATDTVRISGANTQLQGDYTIEWSGYLLNRPVVANPPATWNARIWSEQDSVTEDKMIGLNVDRTASAGVNSFCYSPLVGLEPVTALARRHVALVRLGDLATLFVDGVAVSSAPQGCAGLNGQGSNMALGAFVYVGQPQSNYWRAAPLALDWIRVSGIARYVDGFPVPREPLVADESTQLLINFNGENPWRDLANPGAVLSPGAGVAGGTSPEISVDCDGDGVPDQVQVGLPGADTNADGIPDVCQAPTCADADLFPNGAVNGADLGILLSQWGAAPAGTVSDLNGDGTVDGADLGVLLSFWGPCNG